MNMTTLTAPHGSMASRVRLPITPPTDISRGAAQFGIRPACVHIEPKILDEYSELDTTLGHNIVGVVLTLLAHHLNLQPGGGSDDPLTVCLRRRDDGCVVEVDLALLRTRHSDGQRLVLRFAAERDLDLSPE